jgi:hypothetical protein
MGVKWYEIDPTYYIIKFFSKIGIVRLPGEKAKREHEVDLDLDESIVTENHNPEIKQEALAEA